MSMRILQDLGEREIIKSILPKYCDAIGDDCAILGLGTIDLVVTTDPVPRPAAKVIGGDSDLYWMGWLLVTINASDLAAAGAEPLGFLAAIEATPDTLVSDFERLLQGIQEACRGEGLRYAGGNLREAKELAAVGTAVGSCPSGRALRRSVAEVGNVIVSVGRGGIFWRDAFQTRGGGKVSTTDSPLFKPRSQMKPMQQLARADKIRAAMDNSDGLLPTLNEIARINGVRIAVDLDKLSVPDVPASLKIDPARLWLGWGDWNVVAAVRREDLEEATRIAVESGVDLVEIGIVEQGNGVTLHRGSRTQEAPRLESERFAKDSWFVGGIDSYFRLLSEVELP